MFVLYILIVPIFALMLLSAVFMIGVSDTISPRSDNQDEYPIIQLD